MKRLMDLVLLFNISTINLLIYKYLKGKDFISSNELTLLTSYSNG